MKKVWKSLKIGQSGETLPNQVTLSTCVRQNGSTYEPCFAATANRPHQLPLYFLSLKFSVARWLVCFLRFGLFLQRKFASYHRHESKVSSKQCQILNWHSKRLQRFRHFAQSDKISPNLVTLVSLFIISERIEASIVLTFFLSFSFISPHNSNNNNKRSLFLSWSKIGVYVQTW